MKLKKLVKLLSNDHCFNNISLYIDKNHLVTSYSKDIIRMVTDVNQLGNSKVDFVFPVYCEDDISYCGDIGVRLKDNGTNILYLMELISYWFDTHDHKTRYTFAK